MTEGWIFYVVKKLIFGARGILEQDDIVIFEDHTAIPWRTKNCSNRDKSFY